MTRPLWLKQQGGTPPGPAPTGVTQSPSSITVNIGQAGQNIATLVAVGGTGIGTAYHVSGNPNLEITVGTNVLHIIATGAVLTPGVNQTYTLSVTDSGGTYVDPSPRTFIVTPGPTAVGFTGSSVSSNVSAGAFIGTLSTVDGSSPFSYTCSNSKFTVSGTQLLRSAVGTLTPGVPETLNFTSTDVVSLSTNTQTNGQGPFSLSITGVSSGLTSVTLNNLSSNAYTTPTVSYGLSVKEGDIPLGGSVVVKDTGGNVVTAQQDQVITNPATGLIRYVVLSHRTTENFTANESKTYTVVSSASPPNTSPAAGWSASGTPEATLMANTNFIVRYSGGDCGSSTYSMSVNDVLTNFSQGPGWGTSYPAGGWERYAQGPVCMAWHVWGYIKNDTAPNKYHGYIRTDLYIKAWSPTGPFEFHLLTQSPNLWNTITQSSVTSENYNTPLARFTALATIYDTATPVVYFGGPNDYRTGTISNASFNTSTNVVTMTPAAFQKWYGGAVMLSSSGTLPSGLNNSTAYWVGGPGGLDQTSSFLLCQDKQAVASVTLPPIWAANTHYDAGYSIVVNNNVQYQCVVTGTSAASGGPTGSGQAIVDNTCQWRSLNYGFTTQGTGTITASPINSVFPGTGWVGADTNGDPVWYGSGTRPRIVPGEDFNYLTTKSKATPPYSAVTTYTSTAAVQPFNPMMPSFGYFFIQAGGDGPGDQRIGWMNEDAVNVLYNYQDPYYYNSSLSQGLQWANWPSQFRDERSGYPMTGNNGPNRAGASYTNMASPQPAWSISATPAYGVGNMAPNSTAYADLNGFANRNAIAADNVSHMPSPWYGPYLQTGYKVLHDIGTSHANWAFTAWTAPNFTQYTISGVIYYCVCPTPEITFSQTRSWAWGVRIMSQASWICQDANPMQPLLLDMQQDNIYVTNTWYHDVAKAPAVAQVFGNMTNDHHGAYGSAPWTWAYLVFGLAMEAWRNRQPGWYDFLNDWVKNRFSIWSGSGISYVGLYEMQTRTGSDIYGIYRPEILANSYTTQAQVFGSTYGCVVYVLPGSVGNGYTHATVSFTGPSGTGASYKANIVAGQITSYTVNVDGTGGDLIGQDYNPTATNVVITGDGTGATATAWCGANDGISGYNATGVIPAPYPSQPYMYNYNDFGNLTGSFPGNCNMVPNSVRMALALTCTAIPSNTTLRSQLTDWTTLISARTGVSSVNGGVTWGAVSPGANHKAFCVFTPGN